MLDPIDPCQPILPFDHTKEGEKQRVTHKKTDDRISFVESLVFSRRSFGYKMKISLIGSQSLGLEYVCISSEFCQTRHCSLLPVLESWTSALCFHPRENTAGPRQTKIQIGSG